MCRASVFAPACWKAKAVSASQLVPGARRIKDVGSGHRVGSGVGGQGSGVRGRGSGVGGQGSGVRGQGSGIRGQGSGIREHAACGFATARLPQATIYPTRPHCASGWGPSRESTLGRAAIGSNAECRSAGVPPARNKAGFCPSLEFFRRPHCPDRRAIGATRCHVDLKSVGCTWPRTPHGS